MKPFDPFHPPPPKPKNLLLFSGETRRGKKFEQEDALGHFTDECFIIVDGVGSLPHGVVAATLTRDTAQWAYEFVRQRPNYWKKKHDFMERIFRSTNLTLWQKRREHGFGEGLAAALLVLLLKEDYFWIGNAGNCSAYLYRDGLIDSLLKADVDREGHITKAVGFSRKRLLPTIASGQFLIGDVILLCTDGVADFVSEDQMRTVFEQTGDGQETMDAAQKELLDFATSNGSGDNMTAYLVKRIMK